MATRRKVMIGGGALGLAALGAGATLWRGRGSAHAAEAFEIALTDAEWRERLSAEAYAVLREEATERPYTSPLNDLWVEGTYVCAGCDLPVYPSQTKFESGTGWPSFYDSLPDAVGTRVDYKLLYPRTEVHCARCGGHLGHVFNDGPQPTGLRHCLNGVALRFAPVAV